MTGKLDSLGLAESLRRRMADFASADLYVTDPDIQRAARAVWEDEASGLVGELWVEGIMPPMPRSAPADDRGNGRVRPGLARTPD